MICGLDISTSITGITILDDQGSVVLCCSIDTRNKKHFPTLFEKADHIKEQLIRLKDMHDIKEIYIEQSLQSFRPGFSSAKTLLTLAKFNGIISYICKGIFGIEPEYISASTARKSCGIKIARGQKAKEVVLNYFLDKEPSLVVHYTKHGNPVAGAYDRADSLAIAKAGYNMHREVQEENVSV